MCVDVSPPPSINVVMENPGYFVKVWCTVVMMHLVYIFASAMKSPTMTTVLNGKNKTLYMPVS